MDNEGCLFDHYTIRGRNKKLIAGVWFSLYISDPATDRAESYNCNNCPEKKRERRNCRNRHNLRHDVIFKEGWQKTQSVYLNKHEVQKINSVKFYQCPQGLITARTWDILRLVNETTDADGNILNMPYSGAYLDQPEFYRTAVKIVKSARAENQRNKRK